MNNIGSQPKFSYPIQGQSQIGKTTSNNGNTGVSPQVRSQVTAGPTQISAGDLSKEMRNGASIIFKSMVGDSIGQKYASNQHVCTHSPTGFTFQSLQSYNARARDGLYVPHNSSEPILFNGKPITPEDLGKCLNMLTDLKKAFDADKAPTPQQNKLAKPSYSAHVASTSTANPTSALAQVASKSKTTTISPDSEKEKAALANIIDCMGKMKGGMRRVTNGKDHNCSLELIKDNGGNKSFFLHFDAQVFHFEIKGNSIIIDGVDPERLNKAKFGLSAFSNTSFEPPKQSLMKKLGLGKLANVGDFASTIFRDVTNLIFQR